MITLSAICLGAALTSSGSFLVAPGKELTCKWLPSQTLVLKTRQFATPPVPAGVGGTVTRGEAFGRGPIKWAAPFSINRVIRTAPEATQSLPCAAQQGAYCVWKLKAGVNGFSVSGQVN